MDDWEVVHSGSDSDSGPVKLTDSVSSFDEIDTGGLIQVNYFSLDQQNRRDLEGFDDIKSDNPSWIDPGLEENQTRYFNNESGEFWSDSGSERSEDRKFSDYEGKNGMGSFEIGSSEVGFKEIGEIVVEKGGKIEDLGKFCSKTSGSEVEAVKFDDLVESSEIGVEKGDNMEDLVKICADTSGSEVDAVKFNDIVENTANLEEESVILGEGEGGNEGGVGGENGSKKSGEIEKSGAVWWKMPIEFLRYCVFRMSPVWTVSVAAAVMGFVILGRRLYKMKKKSRGLGIKVTVDDKKVSQVMSRAARLNEAFSVVKLVPVIRPSLPGAGVATWPAMSLR